MTRLHVETAAVRAWDGLTRPTLMKRTSQAATSQWAPSVVEETSRDRSGPPRRMSHAADVSSTPAFLVAADPMAQPSDSVVLQRRPVRGRGTTTAIHPVLEWIEVVPPSLSPVSMPMGRRPLLGSTAPQSPRAMALTSGLKTRELVRMTGVMWNEDHQPGLAMSEGHSLVLHQSE